MRRVQVPTSGMPIEAGESVSLSPDATHYLLDVLRMRTGDDVELFDGGGAAWHCQIDSVEPLLVTAVRPVVRDTESPLKVTLLQAIPKGDRWEWVLEKATELGVRTIVPVQSQRTVVTVPTNKVDRKLERWRRILASAARQSKRSYTPDLLAPLDFSASLDGRDEDCKLYGHPGKYAKTAETRPESVAIWIGPEGGFTDDELEQLETAGAKPLGLGPRVLRSETAGAFACGLVQSWWGDIE